MPHLPAWGECSALAMAAPAHPAAVLELQELRVRYPGSASNTLDGLNLRLHAGERLALVGPSGCGKSTVARAVLQLLPQGSRCQGSLRLNGRDPRGLRRSELRRLRGEAVGLVFQDPMTRLNPLMTIGEHLADTLSEHRPAWQQAQIRERAQSLLQRVGISDERYGSYPHEFSGGMRQRLAIALAMALRPALVIADEPTTSLDVAVAGQVMQELCDLCEEAGSALLLISHDLAMAGRWCDHIAVLDQGRLVEQAAATTLLTRPQSPLAQRLVGAARAREGGRHPPPPMPPLCWSWRNCAAGIPCRGCPGRPVGTGPSMGSACSCAMGKRSASWVPPVAARAPSAAP